MYHFSNVTVMGDFIPIGYQPPMPRQPTVLEVCDRCGRHVSRVGERQLRPHQDRPGHRCPNTIRAGQHSIPDELLAQLRAGNLPPIAMRG